MQGENNKIGDLEKRRDVEVVDTDERCRGARDEDTDLVDGAVGAVKGEDARGKRRVGATPWFMVYSAMYTRRRGSMLW
jgi:hypothetical protein